MQKVGFRKLVLVVSLIMLSFLFGRVSSSGSNVTNTAQTNPQNNSVSSPPPYPGTGQSFEKYFVHIDKDRVLRRSATHMVGASGVHFNS